MIIKYIETLKKCRLFKDISEDGLQTILKCLAAHPRSYEKKEIIMLAGTLQIILVSFYLEESRYKKTISMVTEVY